MIERDTDITELSSAETQHMPAVRDTIVPPVPSDSDRVSAVNIADDAALAARTLEERLELSERRWGIVADRLTEVSESNSALARRAQKRDRWETAMADMGARQNNALTVLLAKGNSVRSEELRNVVALVVEDNGALLPVMRTILSDAGATVYYEQRATDALLRLEKIGPENLTCAVVDVRLPDSDGIGLAQGIRSRVPSCGVVLTSGYSLDDYEGVADRNVYALLDKPFQPRALIDAVLAAIQMRREQ